MGYDKVESLSYKFHEIPPNNFRCIRGENAYILDTYSLKLKIKKNCLKMVEVNITINMYTDYTERSITKVYIYYFLFTYLFFRDKNIIAIFLK